ncbi:MAG: TetR/AcrR family transcriptional regulator [Bacteroidetes bacterium]|nr:TetR/AcrR family transcriptional regulator [Bacteroidota bacterium]
MEDLKHRILQKANELYMKFGIRSVSMDDIARHLGVSKKTLYQHYAEKDQLVFEVNRLHQQNWSSKMAEIIGQAADSIEELLRFTIMLREEIATMNPGIMFDLYKFHRQAYEDWAGFKSKVIRDSVKNTLKRGIDEGFFRKDLDIEILATLRVEQVELGFDDEVFPHKSFSLEQVQLQLFDHFIYGLLTESGRKHYETRKKEYHQIN